MSHSAFRNRRDLGALINTWQVMGGNFKRFRPNREELLFSFVTNSPSGKTFDPSFTVSGGTLNWELGDGSTQSANSFSYTYPNSYNKTVNVYQGTVNGKSDINYIDLADDNIVGEFDISQLTGLTRLFLNINPSITSIKNPVSNAIFQFYNVASCTNLTGILDCSTIDISNDFRFNACPNITQVIHKATSNNISTYIFNNTNITTHDISMLLKLGGFITANNCPNLVSVLFPVFTRQFDTFLFQNCKLNLTTVNSVFSNLDNYYSSNTPTSNLTVNLSGGTNASPTGGSSNVNIVHLNSIFSAAGRVLSIFIN